MADNTQGSGKQHRKGSNAIFTAHLFHVTWEQIRTYFLLNWRLAAIHGASNNLIKWLRWILTVTAVAYLMHKRSSVLTAVLTKATFELF